MRKTQEEKVNSANSLLDILLILKEQILEDGHVASLAYIKKEISSFNATKKYAIYEVCPFPLAEGQSKFSLYAYSLSNIHYDENDKVIIIFTDRNFIASLDFEKGVIKETKDENLHSFKYALIIPTIDMNILLKQINGYNATSTQTLKNVNGTIKWD